MEGTQAASNPVPLVSGKVKYISFSRKNKQREIKKCSYWSDYFDHVKIICQVFMLPGEQCMDF